MYEGQQVTDHILRLRIGTAIKLHKVLLVGPTKCYVNIMVLRGLVRGILEIVKKSPLFLERLF